jgi:hypothetical protein
MEDGVVVDGFGGRRWWGLKTDDVVSGGRNVLEVVGSRS